MRLSYFLILLLCKTAGITQNLPVTWKTYTVGDGSITKTICPSPYQLFPRDNNNMALIELEGIVPGLSSIRILVNKKEFNGDTSVVYDAIHTVTDNGFRAVVPIVAELSEYSFYYQADNSYSALNLIADHVVCGDVFIVSGQSNADTWDLTEAETRDINLKYGPGYYFSPVVTPYSAYCRIFDTEILGKKPLTWGIPALAYYGFHHLGAWALQVQHETVKNQKIPVLFLTSAAGSTDITNNHMPELGEYFFNPLTYTIPPQGANPHDAVYRLFNRLNTFVYAAGVEKSVKAIFWFQGDGGNFDQKNGYVHEFGKMHDLWVRFFPGFKTYLVQVPSWIESEDMMRQISEEQRRIPFYFPDVKIMSANGIGFHRQEPGHEMHFRGEGYENLGFRLLALLENEQYGKKKPDVSPPDILAAARSGNTIRLYFNQEIDTAKSDKLENVLSAVKFNTGYNIKSDAVVVKNKLLFTIKDTNFTMVSYAGYIPGQVDPKTQNKTPDFPCYLRNRNGVGALSFHNIPVVQYDTLASYETFIAQPFRVFPNPFSEFITVDLNEAVAEISITDTYGREIRRMTLNNTQRVSIDLSELPNGMYFIAARTSSQNFVTKIIKWR